MRTLISALNIAVDSVVKVCGWVQTIRSQKRMQFLVVRDHTGLVQAVNERASNSELAATVDALTPESVVEVVGRVVANDSVKLGGLEIVIDSLALVNPSATPLPLQTGASDEQRLDWRFLDLRSPRNLLIFQVQTAIETAMREFWAGDGFVQIHTPKLMGAASESGAELFRLAEYFGREACLAQSPQFYKQMCMAAGFNRVFEIGPVFRAERSLTTRHATEFTSVDVEISWISSHEDVIAWEERWLVYVLTRIREQFGDQIREVFGTEVIVPKIPFPRITMEEAYAILDAQGHTIARTKGDLDPEGERRLCQHAKQKLEHEFIFVTHYPIAVRPFYHLRPEGRPDLTNSYDLLWKGVEITTGAQREHRYEVLLRQAVEKGLDPNGISDYLNFFRYGCPPHGGFGLGLARVLMLLLGLPSIRESMLLFRGPNRLTP